MEAIFCLGAAVPVPSFPVGPNASLRATRLQGAVPVACALGPAYLTRGAVAAPFPWSTKPRVRSSTRTGSGEGDGNPGSIEDLLKKRRGHDQKDGGGGKDVEAEKARDSMLKTGDQLLPRIEALTAILPLEKRLQLLQLLNQLAPAEKSRDSMLKTGEELLPRIEALTAILPLEKRLQLHELLNQFAPAETNEEEIVTKSHLSGDEKLAAGFALSLVYLETGEYAKAKQVLEKLEKQLASTDASRVYIYMATLASIILSIEMYLRKGKRS